MEREAAHRPDRRYMAHRVGYFLVALLLLGIAVSLPFALAGVVDDVTEQANPTFELTLPPTAPAASNSRVHLDIIVLDEWQRAVTIRVSGHHVCSADCDHSDRFLFVSYPPAL